MISVVLMSKVLLIVIVYIMTQMSLIVSLLILAWRLILLDIDQTKREKRG
jgi:hypothetical protein